MTPDPKLVEAVARQIAQANGDDFDALPLGKAEWTHARGQFGGRFRDINEPTKADYLEMGEAALAAIPASGEWWIAPAEATESMQADGRDAIEPWLPQGRIAKPATDQWQIAREVYAAMRDAHLKDTT